MQEELFPLQKEQDILRVVEILARKIAKTFYEEREKLGFPILKVKEENN